MPRKSRLQQMAQLPGELVVPKYRYFFVPAATPSGMTTNFVGAGAGDPAIGELGTASITGVQFAAATDSHAFVATFPSDLDVNAPIDVAVQWSSDQTTIADLYQWTLLYNETQVNSTDDFDTAGATALDTPIASQANAVTAKALQTTAWGTIDADSLSGGVADGYRHTFLLDPAAVGGTPGSDQVVVWGFLFRYMPMTL